MRHRHPGRSAVALAALALLAACGSSLEDTAEQPDADASPELPFASSDVPSATPPSSAPAGPPSSAPASPRTKQRRLVVLISVDGLNPDALARIGSVGVPSFARLESEGAWTVNARTLVEESITLPNHTAMMTGRGVSGAAGTGVTFNEDDGKTLADSAGRYVPGIFDVAHDHGLTTGLYTSKDKFDFLERSWDGEHGAPDRTGPDDGRDKIDDYVLAPVPVLTARVTAALAARRNDLTFFHVGLPDAAGHEHGWGSARYLRAVSASDRAIGAVLDTIDADPWLKARTTVVLTADHGGQGTDHSDQTAPANYTIPFAVWGPGVAAAAELYSLNQDRADPGASRPGYSGAQPVRNLDVASLSLHLLGLPGLRGTWPGSGRTLQVR